MTKTIVATAYGGPEVLALQDIDLAAPTAGQVLVVAAAPGPEGYTGPLTVGDEVIVTAQHLLINTRVGTNDTADRARAPKSRTGSLTCAT